MSEEKKFVFPPMQIGYEVEFAPTEDAPNPSWCLAKAVRVKSNAIDLRVLSTSTLQEIPKMDVRHIGDPSLRKYPPRGDSGVFRLTKNQLELNAIRDSQAIILRRLDALEQTFKAVMESQTGDIQNSVGRRPGRPAATASAGG